MGQNSGIAWCDATFNPWWGCVRVSRACEHCYADTWAGKTAKVGGGFWSGLWGVKGRRRFFGDVHWAQLGAWNRATLKAGERRRVFVASMADVFEGLPRLHPDRFQMDDARERLWEAIRACPHLDFLLLTKRPGSVPALVPPAWMAGKWPLNAWLGTSVEDDRWARKRVPLILRCPAPVHFVSYEPACGPVEWREDWFCAGPQGYRCAGHAARADGYSTRLEWVICGGESGPAEADLQPMHPEWAREARDACQRYGAAFFFKQWGQFIPRGLHPDLKSDPQNVVVEGGRFPVIMSRVKSKAAAGDLLDGRQWREFPPSAAPVPVPPLVRPGAARVGKGKSLPVLAAGEGGA